MMFLMLLVGWELRGWRSLGSDPDGTRFDWGEKLSQRRNRSGMGMLEPRLPTKSRMITIPQDHKQSACSVRSVIY